MLAINNETEDFDALHDAGEVIESLLKRCHASIRARRKLANGIWMKYHFLAQTPPGRPAAAEPAVIPAR